MYGSIYFYFLPVTSNLAVQARCIVSANLHTHFLRLLPFHVKALCMMQIEHWLFTIGYSIAFGTVLAKMWRVYQIFNNPKLNKKVRLTLRTLYDTCGAMMLNIIMQVFKDWHLVIFILLVTGLTILLLVLEVTIPQLRGSVTRVRDLESPDGRTVNCN